MVTSNVKFVYVCFTTRNSYIINNIAGFEIQPLLY